MKKLMLFLFLMISVLVFGQDRVNKSLPSISKHRIPESIENQFKSLIYNDHGLGIVKGTGINNNENLKHYLNLQNNTVMLKQQGIKMFGELKIYRTLCK